MSSTIRSTIESTVGTVPYGYQSKVDAVIAAVEGLAAQAADSIRESAAAAGLRGEQVESALVSAGLVEPEPVVESAEGDLGKVQSTLDALVSFARRHGFTG